MSVKITLSGHELSLLDKARAYVKTALEAGRGFPTRDELRNHLSCGAQNARNLQLYLMDFFEAPEERPKTKEQETQSFKGDFWDITIPATDIHTEQQLIDYMQIDLEKWEIIECTFNKWSMGTEGGGQQALFQVKARCKLKRPVLAVKDEIEALKQQAKQTVQIDVPKIIYPAHNSGLMLELSLYDLHFGKQSWPAETLDRPYDVKIAEAMTDRAVDVILGRANGFRYERILFVVGNDVLHSNDLENRTANGTVVDSDGRFQKAYITARRAMVRIIEKLKTLAPVEVLIVPGNHDRFSSFTLGDSLECYFHNDPNVNIDNAPSLRKYFQWGEVGLMFTHGDEGKRADYPLLFATENSRLFGNTKYREIHTGHHHTTKTEEYHGVRVRTISSLSTPDAWHAQKGFKGALRTAEAFVWSKDEGLIAQLTYNDDAHSPIVTKREVIEDAS
jgi:hypothetical protein